MWNLNFKNEIANWTLYLNYIHKKLLFHGHFHICQFQKKTWENPFIMEILFSLEINDKIKMQKF